MEKLHPGARWVFRIRGYFGAIFLMFFLGWFIFPLVGLLLRVGENANKGSLLAIFLIGILFCVILVIIISEIYAGMAYNRWFYEFTDSNLKLERGIIWKRYSNVPYERVQNVDIHRGILARILGFSSIMIQTAGYSYTGRRPAIEGHIPAVNPEKAERIRDFLMKKISKKHGQGL